MLDDILARFLSRNLDSILKVLTKLNKRIDAYIAREEAEAKALHDQRIAEAQDFEARQANLARAEAEKLAGIQRADRIKSKVGDLIA